MNELTQKARLLRKNQTKQEAKLWAILRNKQLKGLSFKRQFPIGNYIADFICRTKKIIIEIDGGQHNTKNNIEYDIKRTEFLNSLGYKVLRFWNNEIDDNIEWVLEEILKQVDKVENV